MVRFDSEESERPGLGQKFGAKAIGDVVRICKELRIPGGVGSRRWKPA